MFSERKSFWKRRWFLITVIILLGVGYWISQTERFSSTVDLPDGEEVNQRVGSNKKEPDLTPEDRNEEMLNERDEDVSINPPDKDEPQHENFFLVKEVDGTIEIYSYEGEADPIFVRNADIAFSLLSQVDQEMFSKGIIVETEDELDELLQDFGS